MTQHDAISHWRRGAIDALSWAEKMTTEGANALALFHCHLAAEKALKAMYMENRRQDTMMLDGLRAKRLLNLL